MDAYIAVIIVVIFAIITGVFIWFIVSGFEIRVQTFSNSLSPSQEVPPSASTGSGTLSGTLLILNNTRTFIFNISATLPSTDTVTSVGIYQGAVGETGPPLLSISGPTSPPYQWSGDINLTTTITQELQRNMLYVNIFTRQYPNGAIRGQILLD